jgi:excisionase family DNA binding protein
MNIRSGLPRFSLTPDEAAESTGFSRTRIFQAIRKAELTARKDGKSTIIETDELLRWLRSLPTRGRRPPVVEAGTSAG